MRGDVPPLPQYVIMVWCLLTQQIRLHDAVLGQVEEQLYLYLYMRKLLKW